MKNETSINNFFLSDGQTALPKHLALFNGIGGFQLAADWVGWENVAHVEIDEWCNKVVKQHFPKSICYTDIKKFDGKIFRGTIDIISGGFPCQPFSVAGKQGGEEDNRYLWPEMLRVISEVRPAFVVGENVFGIVSISLDQVLSDLEAIGYTTETFIVPACAVNAPHRRDRVWIIGYTEHAGFDATENGKGSIKRKDKICEPTRPTLSRDATENTNGIRCNSKERKVKSKIRGQRESGSGDDDGISITTHTNSNGQQRQGKLGGRLYSEQSEERQINRTEHENQFQRSWYEVASEFCRVDDGLPNRVDRIKGLGNAIVPQVAFQIFTAIDFVLRGKGKKIINTVPIAHTNL